MFCLRPLALCALLLVGRGAFAAPVVPLFAPLGCGARVAGAEGEDATEVWKSAGFTVASPGWVERDGFLFELHHREGPVLFGRHRGVHPLLGMSGKNARIAGFLPPTGQHSDSLRLLLVSAEADRNSWELEQRAGGGGLTALRTPEELAALLPQGTLEEQLQALGFRGDASGYWRRSVTSDDAEPRDWLVRLADGKVTDVLISSEPDLRAIFRNEGLLAVEVRSNLLWLMTAKGVYRVSQSTRLDHQWRENQRFPMASLFLPWREHNILRWNDGVTHTETSPQSDVEPLHTARIAFAGGEWWAELDATGLLSLQVVGTGDEEGVRALLGAVAREAGIASPVTTTPVASGFQLGLLAIRDQTPGLGDDRLRVLSAMFRHFEVAKP